MRVDFYLLSKDTVEAALPRIAKSVKGAGERLLVVSEDAGQLAALDKALWEQFPERVPVRRQPHDRRRARHLADARRARRRRTAFLEAGRRPLGRRAVRVATPYAPG